MDDPTETRLIQTRDGVAKVPRTQEGIPIREYLQNTQLPDDMERSVIYLTETGPVAATPDFVPWSEVHEKQVETYAEKLKEQIDDKGYYKNTLDRYAKNLTNNTGYPHDEMRTLIVSTFETKFSQEPQTYLEDVREQKGLPTRRQSQSQTQNIEPEQ